ncbi:MAG: hypothetical protein ACOCP8_03310 [archaeon]
MEKIVRFPIEKVEIKGEKHRRFFQKLISIQYNLERNRSGINAN